MKLLICLITYNRLECTQKTLEYLLDTIQVPHYIIAVDNHSTDGTPLWLADQKKYGKIDRVIMNQANYYPGRATNMGWGMGVYKYPESTHLMRLDNDFVLLKGWDLKAEEYFENIPTLGQVGLDYSVVENPLSEGYEFTLNGMTLNKFPGNVGGTNIIHRRVWDSGIRYDETPWQRIAPTVPTPQEDVRLSRDIVNAGYLMGHMTEKLAWTFADETTWKDDPKYYRKTMSERGYDHLLDKI